MICKYAEATENSKVVVCKKSLHGGRPHIGVCSSCAKFEPTQQKVGALSRSFPFQELAIVILFHGDIRDFNRCVSKFIDNRALGEYLFVYDLTENQNIVNQSNKFIANGENIFVITSFRDVECDHALISDNKYSFNQYEWGKLREMQFSDNPHISRRQDFVVIPRKIVRKLEDLEYDSIEDFISTSNICNPIALDPLSFDHAYRRKIVGSGSLLNVYLNDKSLFSKIEPIRRFGYLLFSGMKSDFDVLITDVLVSDIPKDTLNLLYVHDKDGINTMSPSELLRFDYVFSKSECAVSFLKSVGIPTFKFETVNDIHLVINEHARPRVVGGMMVMDMGHFVGKTIESVLPALDKLVVVDGGSKDNGDKIEIINCPWDGTFSNSREACFDRVREINPDWYFQIDSDEVMAPGFLDKFDSLLRDPQWNVYNIPILWLLSASPVRYVASKYHTNIAPRRPRLWRFCQGMKFEHWRRVHENFIMPWEPSTAKDINDMDLAIHHHVYILKNYEDRLRKTEYYDSIRPGAGTGRDSEPAYLFEHYPFELRGLDQHFLERFICAE
jgi:hypothetical protein